MNFGRFKDADEIKSIKAKVATLTEKLAEVEAARQPYLDEVEDLLGELIEVRKQIKEFRSDRKSDDSSLYADIDIIFEKHKIFRSAYHGGDINGVGIKQLMRNAAAIMNDVKDLFIKKRAPNSIHESEIIDFCNNMKQFFTLWDESFSLMHTLDRLRRIV